MIAILGWVATALIVGGYVFNARNQRILAIIVWIIGDISWIVYDILINNPSHAVLSVIIIGINLYAIFNTKNIHGTTKEE